MTELLPPRQQPVPARPATGRSALSAFLAETVAYERLPTRLPRPLVVRGAAGAVAMIALGGAAMAFGDAAARVADTGFLMTGHEYVRAAAGALQLVTGSPLVGLGIAALLLYGWAAIAPTPTYVHVLPVATVAVALLAVAAWGLLLLVFALQLVVWAALAGAALYSCWRVARLLRH